MTEYLIINIMVSGWVLAVNRLMTIQAKYKFMLLIFAISSWGIPFGLASFQSNSTVFEHAQPVISSVKVPITNLISQTQTSNFSWQSLLMMLILLGFIRFLIDVIQLYKQHQLYIIKGQATAIKNVFCIKELHNASVSGLFKPKIWIDESLYHSDWAGTIISHEQQHIKAGDTYWLLWITLFQRLFWFNPVMWLLAKQARLAIELRCDVACQQQSQNKKYQTELAQILLKMNQLTSSTINHMSHSPQNNMIRIKQLSKEKIMNKKHNTLLIISMTCILLSSTAILAKSQNDSEQHKEDELLIAIHWKETMNHQGIENLSELTSEIKVTPQKFAEFSLREHTIKVKAQRTNTNESPALYLIETQIIGKTKFPISEPKILVEKNQPSTIRIVNDDSEANELNSLELTFTVLN